MNSKKALILLSVIAIVAVGLTSYYFLKPLSTIEWAERISGLRIDNSAKTLKFMNGNSVFWGGGIICGEFEIQKNQLPTLSTYVTQNDYVYADSLGVVRKLALVMQSSCSCNTNSGLRNHKGYFKLFISTAKESQFSAFDINTGKLYVFKSKGSDVF
ncbi:hypothetical protein [Spirosoma linguale]|uniref:Uncharacterized protein n=1 Tax=Spirosoma linguale (strain ATCC 33905 / DSM 74 / LMG 10896 / Claus 1) TaxID=504472 RepID=D2QMU3_SPILD|nr:hypothetical protein Slin_4526 [Spirosoma linguale DSM 74]